MAIKIRNVKTILTAPEGINLVVVKVETTEPGLYGLGCATFAYRHIAVKCLIDEYIKPLVIGQDVQKELAMILDYAMIYEQDGDIPVFTLQTFLQLTSYG